MSKHILPKRGVPWVAWDRLQLPKNKRGLCFKDLLKFNDSLLAKQAWRLLKHPNSLFARFFKAKYYPSCSALEAKAQLKQSYGWASILVGLQLLKKGIKYNIGDGTSVKVFADNWLPVSPPRPAFGDVTSDLTVSSLIMIQNDNKVWNMGALSSLLSPEDQITVQSIILSNSVHTDTPFWALEPDGKYTVRSGYHLARHLDPGIPLIIPPYGDPALKVKVWSLPILPKLHHFFWRILTRALPTATRLNTRGLNISPTCRRCGQASETINHLFFECSTSQLIWSTANLADIQWISNQGERADDNVSILLDRFQSTTLLTPQKLLPFWILWRIWTSRNSLIFNNNQIHPSSVIGSCLDEVNEWIRISAVTTDPVPQRSHSWLRPSVSWLKVNYEASRDPHSGFSYAGWLVRDDQGHVLSWGSYVLGITSSSLEAEGQALLYCIRDSLAKGLHRIILEGDCQLLFRCLTSDLQDWSIYNLTQDIKIAAAVFNEVNFAFTPREGNAAAHAIARYSRQIYSSVFHNPWLPIWLSDVINVDNVNSHPLI